MQNFRSSLACRSMAATLAGAVALALAGCVVEPVRYEQSSPPPPPPPPSPAAYAEPVGDGVTVQVEPPPLPTYEQPPCPEDGYLWTPGYWAWNGGEYYWVPGTWVAPPRVGVLWTPAFWGFVGGVYVFHAGYWGPHVGFYGGINYGGGYFGSGYHGGRWDDRGRFAYNTAVTNVNTTIVHNTYNVTVVNNNTTINNVSYNGGPRGTAAAPTAAERAAAHDTHVAPTPLQFQHIQQASQNRALLSSVNQGHPAVAATPRPAAFTAPGVVPAHPPAHGAPVPAQLPAPYHPPAQPSAVAPPGSYHPPAQPAAVPPPAPNHLPAQAPVAPAPAPYHPPVQPPAAYHPPAPPAPAPQPHAPEQRPAAPPKAAQPEHEKKGEHGESRR